MNTVKLHQIILQKAHRIIAFVSVMILIVSASAQPVTSVPYFCGFEDVSENAKWVVNPLANPSVNLVNKWTIGGAEKKAGDSAIYINGFAPLDVAQYAGGTAAGVVVAYREFQLPAGIYELSFNWKCLGQTSQDALHVYFVPSSININSNTANSTPPYSTQRLHTRLDCSTTTVNYLSGSNVWKQSIAQLSSAGTTYKLVFVFTANTDNVIGNPSACIDNINIAKRGNAISCFTAPSCLQVNGNVVSWTGSGNANTKYEIQYNGDNSSAIYTDYTSGNVNSYTVPSNVPEGIYSFRVRTICGSDTSIYIETGNVLVYNPAAHCIDYLTLTDNNCWIGTNTNPYQQRKKVDFGYAANVCSMSAVPTSSRHTVHYIQGETDLVVPMLKTKPDGAIASVRVGNAGSNFQGEAVEYQYTVPSANPGVLLLKYAVVSQDPNHGAGLDGSRMIFELLNSSGQQLSTCTTGDFVFGDGSPGWQIYNAGGNCGTVAWKDWTTIGTNLAPYAGQTITIRVTAIDCNGGAHYTYGYFTLDCNDGMLEEVTLNGESCGVKPQQFEVDEGFAYKWYQKYDPNHTPVGNDNVFYLTPQDTATYCVDMISLLNPACYYTLEASSLKKLPKARADFLWNPANCVNTVEITNNSGIFGYYTDNNGIEQEVDMNRECDSYIWDFGTYGTLSGNNPGSIVFPSTGDTITVKLIVDMGACIDTASFVLEIPAIDTTYSYTNLYIRDIDLPYTYDGKTYDIPAPLTQWNSDTYARNFAGCDSVIRVHIDVLRPKTIDEGQILLCADSSVVWHGRIIQTSGDYVHIDSSLVLDHDSIIYKINVIIQDPLTFTLTVNNADAGPNTGSIEIDVPAGGYYEINGIANAPTDNLPAGSYIIVVYDANGCQSAPQVAEITTECISVNFEAISEVCSGDPQLSIPYTLIKGLVNSYSLEFGTAAQSAGFTDVINAVISPTPNVLSYFDIPLPADIRPGNYDVTVKFVDYGCNDTVGQTVNFTILYPSNIVAQKWNDVLAVYNKDYNGGYDFSGFRWFHNGIEIPNEIGSNYYTGTNGEVLDTLGYYQVALQRVGETDFILSCFIEPEIHDSYSYSVHPTVVSSGQPVTILFGLKQITVSIYDYMGIRHGVQRFIGGTSQMNMPLQPGIYTVELVEEDTGNRVLTRVLVR